MDYSTIRSKLETVIAAADLALYLVPMVDEFQGEYIPAYAARLPYVSGFTGSAGLGVFRAQTTAEQRHTLFVDGRYTLQAAKEVDAAAIEVLNSGEVSLIDWLNSLPSPPPSGGRPGGGLRIGLDPWLITEQQWLGWQKATKARGAAWVATRPNLIDGIWDDQPTPPAGEVVLQPLQYAGVSYETKREAILAQLKKHGAESVILTQPDSINWLLNIRGSDVPFNPLLLSYLVLRADGSATLYTYPHQLSAEVAAYLSAQKVAVAALSDVFEGKLTKADLGATVMADASVTPRGWFALLEQLGVEIIREEDPTSLPKAMKNAEELNGIRAAHVRDGLGLSRFLSWFDHQTMNGNYPEELAVVAKLEEFRKAAPEYRGASFATIAGSGPHGAIVHYRADATSNRRTKAGELFLLDSGGQYPDGTTDVTRTMFVTSPAGGTPAPAMREHFTRVLKGHIALASVRFPAGTTGGQLDVLARFNLWEAGLDYDHGTGHGVGAYLCVHEGPQRISKRGSTVALQPGMILSNEPGYYAANQYGIRIENLVCVVEAGQTPEGKPMFRFETLTLAPIDTRLVDIAMLSIAERNWLNAYHRRVHDTHAGAMDARERAWLIQATRAI